MTFKILKRGDLQEIVEFNQPDCVSIFMNTHRIRNERKKDHLVLKNFADNLDHSLKERGLRPPDRAKLLKPLKNILEDSMFFAYLSCGLAIYLGADWHRIYRLPIAVGNGAWVGNELNPGPILPYFDSGNRFFLLSLDQHGCKFYEGSSIDGLFEIELPGMKVALGLLELVDAEKQLQLHSTSAGGIQSHPAYHGHNDGEQHETRIKEYFKAVSNILRAELRQENAPLILAGVDYLHPIYKEVNQYRHLCREHISGNVKDLDEKGLRELAFKTIQPVFDQDRSAIKSRFHEAKKAGRVADGTGACKQAALEGRIETLLCLRPEIGDGDTASIRQVDTIEERQIAGIALNTLGGGGRLVFVDEQIEGGVEPVAILKGDSRKR